MRISRPSLVMIAVVVVLVNVPLLHSTWTRSSVERSGVLVDAAVVEARNLGTESTPSWWLSYRLPEAIDPEQATWSAEVDAAAYAEAEDGTVPVRAIEGKPESAIVDGAIRSSAGLVLTLVVDALLLALLLLLWRRRRGGRREVEAVETVEAIEDVTPAGPGSGWEDLGDGTARVSGEVLEHDDHEVVLDLGDRLVRVVLDGHANPIGSQQPAQVRVRPTP